MPSIKAYNITYLSFRTDLILSSQNETKKVCLLPAQNELTLSFRTDRIPWTQNETKITCYFILHRYCQRKMK